jgi:hypothetical protein
MWGGIECYQGVQGGEAAWWRWEEMVLRERVGLGIEGGFFMRSSGWRQRRRGRVTVSDDEVLLWS